MDIETFYTAVQVIGILCGLVFLIAATVALVYGFYRLMKEMR
jgi:hypothetical protein